MGEGKLHIMWGDSVNVVLEGAHGEEAWQKCTSDEGGGNGEGGEVTFVVYSPRVLNMVIFPVIRCPEVAHSAGRPREYFMYRKFFLRIAVAQEAKETLPCCDLCGM